MSHARTKPAGWALNEKLTSAQINDIDIKTRDSVDKTVAGDTVSGVLTLAAGAGVTVNDGAEIVIEANAELRIEGGDGRFMLESSEGYIDGGNLSTINGGRITLADSDFPLLHSSHSGRSRSTLALFTSFGQVAVTGGYAITTGTTIGGVQTPVIEHTGTLGAFLHVPLGGLHNGATLSSVDIWFRPSGDARGGSLAGITPQQAYVQRIGALTPNAAAPASVSLLSASPATFTFPAYADYIALRMQRFRVTCDQNNVIDTSQYSYHLIIADETGGNAALGNMFVFLGLNYTAIADMRFQ